MDLQIALLLGQDGVASGAIYALLGLALVLVFAVTRVIFIPQGEFVAFGALTLAAMQAGRLPATVWLLVALGVIAVLIESGPALRAGRIPLRRWASDLGYPLGLAALLALLPLAALPTPIQVLATLAIVVPVGPLLYRIAYRPLASASVLILLIVSVSLHLVLVGLGLVFFGAEGIRTRAFSDGSFEIGPLVVPAQQLWIVICAVLLIVGFWLFFGRSLYGKALRATAMNRDGARLMGFSPVFAGRLTFALAALVGGLSGVLISPATTIYYDSGFLIGLKGFVAAILGGLSSYPLAAGGALLVGLLESFASFWASAYKEVLVFTLIIPVLMWLSLTHGQPEDEE